MNVFYAVTLETRSVDRVHYVLHAWILSVTQRDPSRMTTAHSLPLFLHLVERGEPSVQAFPSAIAYLRDGIVERINDKVF